MAERQICLATDIRTHCRYLSCLEDKDKQVLQIRFVLVGDKKGEL